MTYEEVIEILDGLHQKVCLDDLGETAKCAERNEAIDIAIQEVKKRIPVKRITKKETRYMGTSYEYTTISDYCPTCGKRQDQWHSICPCCGQELASEI